MSSNMRRVMPLFSGFSGPELMTGSLRVFRAYEVRRGRLAGPQTGSYHGPGVNAASCVSGYNRSPWAEYQGHAVPKFNCGCGFYAYWSPVADSVYETPDGYVAVVEVFGRTLLGEMGVRAAKLRVLALAPVTPAKKVRKLKPYDIFIMLLLTAYTIAAVRTASVVLFVAVLISWGMILGSIIARNRALDGPTKRRLDSHAMLRAELQANYPDVKIYDDRKQMLKKHPLTDPYKEGLLEPGQRDDDDPPTALHKTLRRTRKARS